MDRGRARSCACSRVSSRARAASSRCSAAIRSMPRCARVGYLPEDSPFPPELRARRWRAPRGRAARHGARGPSSGERAPPRWSASASARACRSRVSRGECCAVSVSRSGLAAGAPAARRTDGGSRRAGFRGARDDPRRGLRGAHDGRARFAPALGPARFVRSARRAALRARRGRGPAATCSGKERCSNCTGASRASTTHAT